MQERFKDSKTQRLSPLRKVKTKKCRLDIKNHKVLSIDTIAFLKFSCFHSPSAFSTHRFVTEYYFSEKAQDLKIRADNGCG